MTTNLMDKTAEQIIDSTKKVEIPKGHFGTAREFVKESEEFADELYETSARQIQRHPAESVTMVFAIGFGLGMVTSWLLRRR